MPFPAGGFVVTPVCDLSAGCVVRWLGTDWTVHAVTVERSRVVVRYAEMTLPVRYAIDEKVEVVIPDNGDAGAILSTEKRGRGDGCTPPLPAQPLRKQESSDA